MIIINKGPGTKITLVNTYADWENISDAILQDVSAFPFIGLDTEWVSKKGKMKIIWDSLEFLEYYLQMCKMFFLEAIQ